MTDTTETEFKLRASRPIEVAAVDAALRELGAVVRTSGSRRQIDVYLDDDRGSLARVGIGLRIRSEERGSRVTCKTRGSNRAGLFVREEHEADWPTTRPPDTARELPEAVRDQVEPFVRERRLQPWLQLITRRETRVLQQDERDLCELVIDQVAASAGERSATFAEVELEVVDDTAGVERLAAALQGRLPLQPADDDKPHHAATLLGLPLPMATTAPTTADTPLGEALVAALTGHLHALQRAEARVRSDRGPAALHDMRVEVRRLRVLVRAFRDLWPAEQAPMVAEALMTLNRRLGTARDLDVLLAELRQATDLLPPQLHAACDHAVAWAAGERDRAHEDLRIWLRSEERLHDQSRLERLLLELDQNHTLVSAPLASALHPRLQKAVATVQRLAKDLPPELPLAATHALRIAAKRLRYLAEEFRDLPGHDYERALRLLVTLQQAFGSVCDHEVAVQRLVDWIPAVAAANSDGALTAGALGGLAALHGRRARRARKAATKALERLDRKKVWRQFPAPPEPDANLAP
jgi:inorganic triphosphatase YgiF